MIAALTRSWLSCCEPCSVRRGFGDGDTCGFLVDDGVGRWRRLRRECVGQVVDRVGVTLGKRCGSAHLRPRKTGCLRVPAMMQVMADAVGGLGVVRAGDDVAHRDALVECGQHAEAETVTRAGLAGQEATNGHPESMSRLASRRNRFELMVIQQVGFVDAPDDPLHVNSQAQGMPEPIPIRWSRAARPPHSPSPARDASWWQKTRSPGTSATAGRISPFRGWGRSRR